MKAKSARLPVFLHLLRSHWPRGKEVLDTFKTVLWGWLGIRSCRGAIGATKLNPVYVVIAAIISVALFILTLLTIVHIVTS